MNTFQVKNKGFFLIEAILASGLMAATYLGQAQLDKQFQENNKANLLSKEISQIIHAVDKRILLDGNHKPSGWTNSWSGINQVFGKMAANELIGSTNPSCGSPSGWNPVNPENSPVALIECATAERTNLPFKFDVEARSIGSATSANYLYSWNVTLFHNNDTDFDKYFHLYSLIKNKGDLHSDVEITGNHATRLIDRTTQTEISANRCLTLKDRCGIQFSYETNLSGVHEDTYLRIDGRNSMRGGLSFSSNANNRAKCFKSEESGSHTEVDCGFTFNESNSGLVDSVSNSTSSKSLLLSSGVATPVYCKDDSYTDSFCGMSVISSGGSQLARAQLHAVNLYDHLTLRKDDVSVDVKSDGEISATQNGKVLYHLGKDGKITSDKGLDVVNGEVRVFFNGTTTKNTLSQNGLTLERGSLNVQSGDTNLNGKLTVKKQGIFEKEVIIGSRGANQTELRSAGGVLGLFKYGTNQPVDLRAKSLRLSPQYREGQSCSERGLAVNSGGDLLACKSGRWKAILGLPKGAVFAFGSSTCPNGSSKVPNMDGRTIVGSGRLNDGTANYGYSVGAAGGKQRHKLTVGEMPNHNHGSGFGEAYKSHAPHGTVGGRGKIGSGDTDFDNYEHLTSKVGGNQYHENRMPFRVFTWCRAN